jgi:RNA polymerase-binding transcription factor DksA
MQTTSDDGLRDARERLLARDAELRERLQRAQDNVRGEGLPRDAPDAAIIVENDEVLEAVRESARAELGQIQYALERVETGTYGVCEQCGERIEPERLRVVPYAARCTRCAPNS